MGDCVDSVIGGVDQDVEGCFGIDEKGGHVVAVAGEGFEAVFGVGGWFCVGWIGMKCFHLVALKEELELP